MLPEQVNIYNIENSILYIYKLFYYKFKKLRQLIKFSKNSLDFTYGNFFFAYSLVKYLIDFKPLKKKKRKKSFKKKLYFFKIRKKKKIKRIKRILTNKTYRLFFLKKLISANSKSKKHVSKLRKKKMRFLFKLKQVTVKHNRKLNKRTWKYFYLKKKRKNLFRFRHKGRKFRFLFKDSRINTLKNFNLFYKIKNKAKINFLKFQKVKNLFQKNINKLTYSLAKRVFYSIKSVHRYFKYFYAKKNKNNIKINNYAKFKNLIFSKKSLKQETRSHNLILVDVNKPLLRKLRLVRQAHWQYLRKGNLNRERYSKLLLSSVDYGYKNITKNLVTSLLVSFFFKILSWRQLKMCIKYHLFSINQKFRNNYTIQKGDIVESLVGFYLLNFQKFSKKFSKKHIFRVKKWLYISYLCLKNKKIKKRKNIPSFVIKSSVGVYQPASWWVIDYSTNTAVFKNSINILIKKQFEEFHITTLLKLNNWRYNV